MCMCFVFHNVEIEYIDAIQIQPWNTNRCKKVVLSIQFNKINSKNTISVSISNFD